MSQCFHCGSDNDTNSLPIFAITPKGKEEVCCLGCKAVTEHIYGSGLDNYYEYRTELALKPSSDSLSSDYDVFADEEYVKLIVEQNEVGNNQLTLAVDGIHCAACAWLIEQATANLTGLISINVNTINQRANIIWDNEKLKLSEILVRFAEIGYPATPFKVTDTEKRIKQQEKVYIKRLGIAGLFTMQIMMVAIATYFGAFSNMDLHQKNYFNWISLLLSIPVIFYSAVPFLQGALTSFKSKRLTMDVPVAVAIYGAFTASFYQLLNSEFDAPQGEVFFESITMFTFLLLIGKYLEFRAKSKAVLSNANLNASLPSTISKVINGQSHQTVLVKDINIGDRVYIRPGEQIPIDGTIEFGESELNESVINGEFTPVSKKVGDKVMAGSINADGGLTVIVTATGQGTTLAEINRLQQNFSNFKPKYSLLADKVAHWFVFAQLVISTLTYVAWSFISPNDALWIALSVLVATCPCALSLATPTAYTCAISTLSRKGILIKEPEAFDRLNSITDACFDKTGTLTEGRFTVTKATWSEKFNSLSENEKNKLLAAIAQLEQHSEHPIAKAFDSLNEESEYSVIQETEISNIKPIVNKGVQADYKGQVLKIGSASFCGIPGNNEYDVFATLGDELLVSFKFTDAVRLNTKQTLQKLKQRGLGLIMMTGDSSQQVESVQNEVDLSIVYKGCSPKKKAQNIQNLQSQNKAVVMVGDGINDAPVFAAADVSIAMASGADISKQAADIIVLNNNLSALTNLFESSARTRQIIKQNLRWALLYNLFILPIAIAGLVPPYIAVIGMSASSIVVVSNSLRLLK